jgi:hypothetical protein
MSEAIGRSMPLSLGRRVTCDFLHASMKMPMVAVQKQMNVAEVAAARLSLRVRPSWCSIFTKAYGKVVASRPDMRRAFLSFPWERMFEYTATTADIVVEAPIGDETVLLNVPLKRPESTPLLDIDRRLAWCREDPLERVRNVRRSRRLARCPRVIRHAMWWYLLNVSGPRRSRYFGTYGVTSVGKWGVESLRPIAPWISLLHYGMIDSHGNMTVRLTYDHRVLDGSGPSLALVELEKFLKTEILAELKAIDEKLLKAA